MSNTCGQKRPESGGRNDASSFGSDCVSTLFQSENKSPQRKACTSTRVIRLLGMLKSLSLFPSSLCACMREKPLDTIAASAGVTQMPVEKGASPSSNSAYF